MSVLLRHQVILGLIAGLVFFTNLGGYALFDEDEPKNAVCGREMYERGDWIVPTFNTQLRTDKPILIYWWMHLSFLCFGVSEFSARLGSAILTTGTVLMTYHIGRKLYTSSIAFLAAIILATCLMFSAVGRAVTPDATLIFSLMLCFSSYIWAVAARRGGHFCGSESNGHEASPWTELLPASVGHALPMYGFMGLAILAKGPIGVLLPCAIVGLFLLVSMRRNEIASGRLEIPSGPWWRRMIAVALQLASPSRFLKAILAMRLVWGLAMVLLVAAPWYFAVGLRTNGDWLKGFLGDHNLGRFLEAKESHSGPIFYYLIVLMLGCFPWSVFLPFAIWKLRDRLMKSEVFNDSDRLLACWTGVWIVFFSLASTKLPNYVLPMYPALALLIARCLRDWQFGLSDSNKTIFRNCCRALGAVSATGSAGLLIAIMILTPGDEWLVLFGMVPLSGSAMAYYWATKGQRTYAVRTVAVTAIALAVLVVGVAPRTLALHQESPKLAEAARVYSGQQHPRLGVVDGFSPSLIFYAGDRVRGLPLKNVPKFLAMNPDGFLVTRADRIEQLPKTDVPLVEVARCRRFLRQYDMVLLGRERKITWRSELQRN